LNVGTSVTQISSVLGGRLLAKASLLGPVRYPPAKHEHSSASTALPEDGQSQLYKEYQEAAKLWDHPTIV
jgi:hypothetical protein